MPVPWYEKFLYRGGYVCSGNISSGKTLIGGEGKVGGGGKLLLTEENIFVKW